LVAAAKDLVEATKKSFFVPNFVAVTKPLFSVLKSLTSDEKKGRVIFLRLKEFWITESDQNWVA